MGKGLDKEKNEPRDFFLGVLNSQWNLGDVFPIVKKIPNLNFIFFKDRDFHSVNTHTLTSSMVAFSFNFMAKVCVIANLFFIDQK